jgi:TAG lipase/steryl ester hydrolase/phospholipase A2/LPA acyltransferase
MLDLYLRYNGATSWTPVSLLPRLPAAPNVLIWSAVACSSAFPFLYAPQQLLARDSRGAVVDFNAQEAGELQRRWRDGSLEEDLPMRGLSEMFNVSCR